MIVMRNVLTPLKSLGHINRDEKADWMVCVEKILYLLISNYAISFFLKIPASCDQKWKKCRLDILLKILTAAASRHFVVCRANCSTNPIDLPSCRDYGGLKQI
jgi:hypothetical protein